MIVFQGLEDEVVPPTQAEMMVEALRAQGRARRLRAFEGEQHGFRQAANIIRALEAELVLLRAGLRLRSRRRDRARDLATGCQPDSKTLRTVENTAF